jgi:hypothetical protein
MTPIGMIIVFALLLAVGILLVSIGAWVAGALLLVASIILACRIIKEIIDANDQPNS